MFSPSQIDFMTIRTAEPQDQRRLEHLAALDSARPLNGNALVAEVDGDAVAALDLGSGRAIADPFRPTATVLDMLRMRAAQLQ
jgi:hypothetical protein